MISPNYDSMGQLEFLEKALPQSVKDRMSLVQKTPDQLWDQLDDLFADPKTIVQEAVKELHELDAKKLGDNFVIKLATTLVDTETWYKWKWWLFTSPKRSFLPARHVAQKREAWIYKKREELHWNWFQQIEALFAREKGSSENIWFGR